MVNVAYLNDYGYLDPYKGNSYHLQGFQCQEQSRNQEEVFNCADSSLCNVIEHTFEYKKKGMENFVKHVCIFLQNTSSGCNDINNTT